MEVDLFQQGVDLMLFGMGTVFVFLTLLVVGVRIMSWVVEKFFPEPEPETEFSQAPLSGTMATPVDSRVLTVIQQAIQQHRAKIKS